MDQDTSQIIAVCLQYRKVLTEKDACGPGDIKSHYCAYCNLGITCKVVFSISLALVLFESQNDRGITNISNLVISFRKMYCSLYEWIV